MVSHWIRSLPEAHRLRRTHHIFRNWRLADAFPCGYRARMAEPSHDSVTRLLQRWSEGDSSALDRLLALVYADLRRLASRELRSTPGHATLQTTALVRDVILRLLGRPPSAFDDRSHLLNGSARMMRQILVDRARKAHAEKRGGRWIRDDFTEALELPTDWHDDSMVLSVFAHAAHHRSALVRIFRTSIRV